MHTYVLVECFISAGILLYVWFCPIGRLRRDDFRADIRRIRDSLFDFMWQNGYSYDTPAYIQTRQTLNGILRLSNTLSIPRFLIITLFLAKQDGRNDDLHESLMRVENDHLRARLEKAMMDAATRMLRFVFLEGTAGTLAQLLGNLMRTKEWARRKGRDLLSNAYELGGPSLSTDQRVLLSGDHRAVQNC